MKIVSPMRGERSAVSAIDDARSTVRLMLVLVSLTVAYPAAATEAAVTSARVRPTVPGQPVSAAYFTITSEQNVTLTQVRSDAAGTTQMHNTTQADGVMRMRQLDRVALPAGKSIHFAPGGMHLMLLELKKRLQLGGTVLLDLILVDDAGGQTVVQAVAPIKASTAQ